MRTRIAAAAIAAAALLTLTACNSDDTKSSAPSSTPSVDTSSIEAAAGIPPKPDAATSAKYIAALTAIDPDIVHGKNDTVINRGRDECSSIKTTPKDRAKLIDLANQRFTSPNHPEGFGPAKAAVILDAVHKYLCPTF